MSCLQTDSILRKSLTSSFQKEKEENQNLDFDIFSKVCSEGPVDFGLLLNNLIMDSIDARG